MCGRLACGLNPDELRESCCYKESKNDNYIKPLWKTCYNLGKTYKASFNVCPTEVSPVLLSGSHFNSESRVLAPMIFGVIPPCSTDGTKSKYSTINCKIENIKTSSLYSPLLRNGQRCLVVCNGFFEWKKGNEQTAQPYLIHSTQPNTVNIDNPSSWKTEFSQEEGFNGISLLYLAALFERKTCNKSGKETFSFTIITKEAHSEMTWLHHRFPAIISNEEQKEIWLNFKDYNENQALLCLNDKYNISYYPVSTKVNFTTIKTIDCIKKNNETKNKQKRGTQKDLRAWLNKKQKLNVCESDKSCTEEGS